MEHAVRKFVDAQEMAKLYPATFEAPDQPELDDLQAGQNVKVCIGDERFWVMVGKVTGDVIEGMVDNYLINTDIHCLKYGDVIQFEKRHVYSIFK